MAWENTGRISVSSGSTTVTGSGTQFTVGARVGDGLLGPDGKLYEITNIVSNTSLTIAPAYGGSSASNQTYKIVPVRGYSKLAADRLQDVLPAVQQAEGIEDWMSPFDKLEAQKAIGDLAPISGGIPRADAAGKLDEEWFSDVFVRLGEDNLVPIEDLKASIQAAADTLVLTDGDGKIHGSRLDIGNIAEAIVATFSQKVQDILSRNTAAEIRGDLGLGSAATRDVGTERRNLMEVGAFGLDAAGVHRIYDMDVLTEAILGSPVSTTLNQYGPYGSVFNILGTTTAGGSGSQIVFHYADSNNSISYRRFRAGEWYPVVNLHHTGNTTTDSNGFIKAASPVIRLFPDKIEKTDHLEIQSAAFEKLGTGKYKLTGVPELSRDGWYIETPKDRNNNIYFTLDYEELDGELIIKTYEPDYSTGKAENGSPVDILEGRFVSLRFKEDPSLYPEEGEE